MTLQEKFFLRIFAFIYDGLKRIKLRCNKMKITVIYPHDAHSAYSVALNNFIDLAKNVSGECAKALTDKEYIACNIDSDLNVLIGNDTVNQVTANLYLAQKIDKPYIRHDKDDYVIKSYEIDGKNYLVFAGGCPRATIYAVYRYFELFCGCKWFWDGDRISKSPIVFKDINVAESPRFDYRGIRYFTHRSLHRFQAEHWDFEDWKKEIDYILKKRLNLFMLRIGMDDLWQKAFPEIVPYPSDDYKDDYVGQAYNDRTPFWNLKFRGELRKKILDYAFERDLLHPEDCGTMTHWYSKTPKEFIEKENPTLLPLAVAKYDGAESQVWDIRDSKNLENYFKLTKTHIKEYGCDKIFHTIGLGERMFSKDREENKRMKLFVYRKIADYVKKNYPNAPLFIASWDLWMRYTPEEVQDLVAELDPTQAVIFDYTSDALTDNNFTKWGLIGKFPWVFGMFGGYEPNNEIRGTYNILNEKVKLAKSDDYCKGFIFWPEFSHGDNFALEYLARNSWDSETLSVEEQINKYCQDRYPAEISNKMTDIWHKFMPIVQTANWAGEDKDILYFGDFFTNIFANTEFKKEYSELYKAKANLLAPYKANATQILKDIAQFDGYTEMTRRDMFDISRTIISRCINALICKIQYLYTINAPLQEIEKDMCDCYNLLDNFTNLLGLHEDYSLRISYDKLNSVQKVNPNFEQTLKTTAECGYCRSQIYESCKYLYLSEMQVLFSEIKRLVNAGESYDKGKLKNIKNEIREKFINTPLNEMTATPNSFAEVITKTANVIESVKFDC